MLMRRLLFQPAVSLSLSLSLFVQLSRVQVADFYIL